MQHVHDGTLSDIKVEFSNQYAACVVVASGGYPKSYQKGCPITIGNTGDALVYHAGSKLSNGRLVTAGGRVLGVTALGGTLQEAVDQAYAAAAQVQFDGAYYRRDIGKKALEAAGE